MPYVVEFAPDGEHWSVMKKGKIDKLWDYFVNNIDITEQLLLNPFAKFRLKNQDTGQIIGELPRE